MKISIYIVEMELLAIAAELGLTIRIKSASVLSGKADVRDASKSSNIQKKRNTNSHISAFPVTKMAIYPEDSMKATMRILHCNRDFAIYLPCKSTTFPQQSSFKATYLQQLSPTVLNSFSDVSSRAAICPSRVERRTPCKANSLVSRSRLLARRHSRVFKHATATFPPASEMALPHSEGISSTVPVSPAAKEATILSREPVMTC